MLKKFHNHWNFVTIVILTMVKSDVLKKLRINIWLTKMFARVRINFECVLADERLCSDASFSNFIFFTLDTVKNGVFLKMIKKIQLLKVT